MPRHGGPRVSRWTRLTRTVTVAVVVGVITGVALSQTTGGAARRHTLRFDTAHRPVSHFGRTTSTTTTPPPAAPTPTTARPAPVGAPYAVTGQTLTWVDTTRTTPARGSVPASQGRTLRTVIRRPAGLAGPLPLVVFAHGYDTEPETYEPLLQAWAAAGYLVAAPECPGSAQDLPGTPVADYAEQARDLSFVITQMLGGAAGPVSPGQVVVAGHSDGGTAVTILALNAAYADGRIKAYMNLAGQIPPDVPGPWGNTPVPGALLVAVGANDEYGNLSLSTAAYDAAHMPKALLTVPGGDHEGTFIAPTPTAQAVRAATVRFLGLVFGTSAGAVNASEVASALGGGGGQPYVVTYSG